jgi:hypothetical protein
MIRYSLVALLVLLPLSLTACGGGGEEAAQPTAAGQPTSAAAPTPMGTAAPAGTPTPASTPAITPTPMSTPTIIGNLFEFKDRGYSVRFPEGWTPVGNYLPGPGFSVDAFFAPQDQTVADVQPNIAVTCETLPKGMSTKDYFDREVLIVKQVTKIDPETSSREVSGQEALQLRFTRENIKGPLEKTEVMFVTDKCGWNISMTVPFSSRESYHEPFEEFVNSFQLLP